MLSGRTNKVKVPELRHAGIGQRPIQLTVAEGNGLVPEAARANVSRDVAFGADPHNGPVAPGILRAKTHIPEKEFALGIRDLAIFEKRPFPSHLAGQANKVLFQILFQQAERLRAIDR